MTVDFGQGLTDAWSTVVSAAPLVGGFLLILIVGWIVSYFLGKIIGRILARVGLDRAVERSPVGEYFQRSRYGVSELIGKIIYYSLLLLTLNLAFNVFGPNNPVSQLLNAVVAWIPHAFVALVIVVVAVAVAKMARDLISGALGGLSYGRLLATLAFIAIVALGAIAALNQVGIATTVTQPVLIAILATVGGILVVGVGGGMIRPMQDRWSRWLDTAEREAQGVGASPAYESGRADAMQGREEAQQPTTGTTTGTTQSTSNPM
jgi:MFS family permease